MGSGTRKTASREAGPGEDCSVDPVSGKDCLQAGVCTRNSRSGYAVKPSSLNPRAGTRVPGAGETREEGGRPRPPVSVTTG